MVSSHRAQPQAPRGWSRLVWAGVLTTVGILSGVVPQVATVADAGLGFQGLVVQTSGAVQAQSDELIVRYARAAYEMEMLRRRDFREVKQLMGGNVPDDVCDRSNIPGQVQAICGRFSGRLDGILSKHGLSRSDFNSVHRRANDPSVQQRIQQELMRLQAR
jgi:hypothetical protein